ncbi:MAG: PD-(D/E)XK nuclease family protein [Gemmataceae bacterium]|nr:PD-(D/E)XK nuclease family protein [Gemmataceae bacterium]
MNSMSDSPISGVSETFKSRVLEYLSTLRAKLVVCRAEIEERVRSESPDFNVFQFIQPDENRLSDIIAALLDPNGNHGQGELFLAEFLEIAGIATDVPLEAFRVVREDCTTQIANPLRRIDIVLIGSVNGRSFGIGIENKPWAVDQPNQVKDYVDELVSRFKDRWHMIYLCREGSGPTASSICATSWETLRSSGKCKVMTFRGEFSAWLKRCFKVCKSLYPRAFLQNFAAYIDSHLS